jgi:two-component system sensor histidine kinase AgrC
MILVRHASTLGVNLIIILIALMIFYYGSNLLTTKVINKLYIQNLEKEQLAIDIQTIKDVEMEMSKLRHNHLNSLLELKEYINNNDMEGLQKAYHDIIHDYDDYKGNHLTSIIKIKNLSVRSILSSKLNEMEKHDIEYRFEVSDYIDDVNMNNHDLCQILGIYIDNAIEASKLADDKKINITIVNDKEYLSFIINNSFEGQVDINKINERGFSTKGKNRGNGLYICKNIISKYDNIENNTYVDRDKFFQELYIKKRS